MASILAILEDQRATLKSELNALVTAAETDSDPIAALDASAERRTEITRRIGAIDREYASEAARRELANREPAMPSIDELAAKAAELEDKVPAPSPFNSLGGQLRAVAASSHRSAPVDRRLVAIEDYSRKIAAASGLNEATTSEGGFLVQYDMGTELYRSTYDSAVLASRCRRRPVTGNGFRANAVDETSRVDGSRMGGLQAYWQAEAGTATATKPKFRAIEMKLEKLLGVYYATDELLEDEAALSAEVEQWFRDEFGFKIDDGILRGDGVGKPLGILNSGALVTVAAEGGQTAGTINAQNIAKMLARLPGRSLPGAAWTINQDAFPQFPLMTLANQPIWLAQWTDSPMGAVLGRPLIPAEQCSSIGILGDIVLADYGQYLLIEKNGIATATSIHVQFLTDETAFRFTLRINGQPIPSSTVTPYKGSNTISPFVTLAAR